MDGARFDDLTRQLAGRRTRRSVLRGLAGLAAGAVGLGATKAIAAACPAGQVAISGGRCVCKSTMRPPGPSGCPAGPGQTLCNGVGIDLTSDVNNCGACGYSCVAASPGACAGSPVCRASACIYLPLPAGTVCRPAVGRCDVAEVCNGTSLACPADAKAPAGTACGNPASCTGGVQHRVDSCDTSGTCVAGANTSCGLYVCGATACLTNCTTDDHCVGAAHCEAGTCVNDGELGAHCDSNGDCKSGHCNLQDGICCSEPCAAGVGCGGADHTCCAPTCTGRPCGADDGCGGICLTGTCGPNQSCVKGVCRGTLPNTAPCDTSSHCQSGSCSGETRVCCSEPCPPGAACDATTGACICGAPGQVCCTGDVCHDNGTCYTSADVHTCQGAGQLGDHCDGGEFCAGGVCNLKDHVCCAALCGVDRGCPGPDFHCQTCGASNQECCADDKCDPGLECVPVEPGSEVGICATSCSCEGKACGDNGCGGTCGTCGNGQVCTNTHLCADCGGLNQLCCAGALCHDDPEHTLVCSTSGYCRACGESNNLCCAGQTCHGTLHCSAQDECVSACGGRGQVCCQGSTCQTGAICNDDIDTCLPCGGHLQGCCAGNTCLEAGTICDGATCQRCGGLRDRCCAGHACNDTLECTIDNVCAAACGGKDEICCAGDNGGVCDSGLNCLVDTCRQPCGEDGAACCNGANCLPGLMCVFEVPGGICRPCGGDGGPCCGTDCNDGFTCDNTSTCRPCGAQNQLCCVGVDGSPCDSGLRCNSTSSVCEPCGAQGQACCPTFPGFICNDSHLYCDGVSCVPCGGQNQPCCAGGACDNPLTCSASSNRCTA